MDDRKTRVIVIVGATGSGKSDLAIRIAREFNGEIICADSRTVYRGMDVGTAKIVGGSGRITHHFLDIRDLDQPYSVAEFKNDAEQCMRDIIARGKLPIVVGGTMLYVRALVDNLNLAGAQPNPERRAELEQMPLAVLQKLFANLDPNSIDQVDVKNPRRLIRAIETIEATGMTLAASRATRESPFLYCILCLNVPREELRQRIAARTHAMFARGLVSEVQCLLAQYGPTIEPLRGVVYREVVVWLSCSDAERVPQQQLEQQINAALCRYARRQLAWFRKDQRVQWVASYAESARVLRDHFT